jgi:hypothetical protein
MRKIVELKIEETKTVVGGVKAATVATASATASTSLAPRAATIPVAM